MDLSLFVFKCKCIVYVFGWPDENMLAKMDVPLEFSVYLLSRWWIHFKRANFTSAANILCDVSIKYNFQWSIKSKLPIIFTHLQKLSRISFVSFHLFSAHIKTQQTGKKQHDEPNPDPPPTGTDTVQIGLVINSMNIVIRPLFFVLWTSVMMVFSQLTCQRHQ